MRDSCTCAAHFDAGNLADPVDERIVKAQKIHICCECREEIKPGEFYERTKGKWDQGWDTFKTCIPCQRIRKNYFCEGFCYGQIWEDLIEHFREIYWNYDAEAVDDFSFMLPEKFRERGKSDGSNL